MCEMFGISSAGPTRPRELLCSFAARGGESADNPDGWGLAAMVDNAFRITKEPQPAAHSPRFRALCHETRSALILAHVRKANPPTARVLANTHPFSHVCCGREWVFAHNGRLAETDDRQKSAANLCTPAGDTDSEYAFCLLLERIAAAFAPTGSGEAGWFDALAQVAETLASHGRFNFLMSDGTHLIAYGHDRLHALEDAEVLTGITLGPTVVLATEPLTECSAWSAFAPGELRVYRSGSRVLRLLTHPRASQSALAE
jgi:glutamine amidotransferase